MSTESDIAKIAQAIIDGEIRLIEGARRIAILSHQLSYKADQDILYFIGLDSEANDHPLGEERLLWNSESLSKLDLEVFEYEKCCMNEALLICKRLVKRFGG